MSKEDLVHGFPLAKRPFVAFTRKDPCFPGQPNERLRAVRRMKTDIKRRVNGDVAIELGAEGMTSYAGLELLIR